VNINYLPRLPDLWSAFFYTSQLFLQKEWPITAPKKKRKKKKEWPIQPIMHVTWGLGGGRASSKLLPLYLNKLKLRNLKCKIGEPEFI